jgi:hypothetical protein
MSSLLLRELPERACLHRSSCRSYPGCLPDRKSMSSLRELLQHLLRPLLRRP